MAAGIAPNVALARTAGVPINRGIVVDDGMQTDIPGHYAIGECAEHDGRCVGLVEPAYEQAAVLADTLTGGSASYAGSIPATNLKVTGVNVFSAGDFIGARRHRAGAVPRPAASASTRSSSSRTTAWSARCCSAIPRTASGIST